MKKLLSNIYILILYIALAIVNGMVFVFGAKPKLIKKKLFIGSVILTFLLINTKKTQAQVDCYKTCIVKPITNEAITVFDTTKVLQDTTYNSCYMGIYTNPEFPGGQDVCLKFKKDNIQYPIMAIQNKIQGTSYVKFVVEVDGSISNVSIIRGIGGECDEEALRIIKMMPKWLPGKLNGKIVRCNYMLPVHFYLCDNTK